jgi:hypothetical protein
VPVTAVTGTDTVNVGRQFTELLTVRDVEYEKAVRAVSNETELSAAGWPGL